MYRHLQGNPGMQQRFTIRSGVAYFPRFWTALPFLMPLYDPAATVEWTKKEWTKSTF